MFSRKLYRLAFELSSGAGNHKIEVSTSRPKVNLLGSKQNLRLRAER